LVFKILEHLQFQGDRTTPYSHYLNYHQMLLEKRNKNIYGLREGISTVFEIFSNFPFLGGGGGGGFC
jgi:hypothetical protein